MNTSRNIKKVLIIIFLVLVVFSGLLLFFRFFLGGDEDTWICQDGIWVKHGNPSSLQPNGSCIVTKGQKTELLEPPYRTVEKFYTWYLKETESPFISGSYKSSDSLTDSFKNKVNNSRLSFNKSNYDPIVLAQVRPLTFKVEQTLIKDNLAKIIVSENFEQMKQKLEITLLQVTGIWKINSITNSL